MIRNIPRRISWACLLLLAAAAPATAAPPVEKAAATGAHHFRASTIEGLKVMNPAGEELGKVNDLVIDMGSGQVVYAALEYGGFLGVGDKLFAVPFKALQYSHSGKERHLVLDASKDHLKKAPGFDKNHWPDMADPSWSRDVDQFYGHPSTASAR